ncbi:2'-5' RNA ligase family protein [Clostridium polynesiense]|uniref:2'-5' RNA ligase family protein n=1 Tax=Clostridium polynesiense TaxID=1325933 RepID=UPI00058F335F|nr:2'-5' RNA ligase family protein [Clostridium polynesiense]
MRYVIVSKVKGAAGSFNEKIKREVLNKFNAKSSKLPAHFTIKAPFESEDISRIEHAIEEFCKTHKKTPYIIKNYDHFEDRVIYMKVILPKKGRQTHDDLIESLSSVSMLTFKENEGKDKIFHVTIASKKIRDKFKEIWDYVNNFPCEYECDFDNISIYRWVDNTWKLYREFELE